MAKPAHIYVTKYKTRNSDGTYDQYVFDSAIATKKNDNKYAIRETPKLKIYSRSAIITKYRGSTINFNQLYYGYGNENYITNNKNGSITINYTNNTENTVYMYFTNSANFIASHKYLFEINFINKTSSSDDGTYYFNTPYFSFNNSGYKIFTLSNNSSQAFWIWVNVGKTINDTFYVNLYDLTQMGLEDITYSDFKKMFPLAYYEYDPGSLVNFTNKQYDDPLSPENIGDFIGSGLSPMKIQLGDTMDINWLNTATGTSSVSGHTVTVDDFNLFTQTVGEAEAGSYKFTYDGVNWRHNNEIVVLKEAGITLSSVPNKNEVLTITTTIRKENYTFTSYDTVSLDGTKTNAKHAWLLEQTYCPSTKTYDTYEAIFAVYKNQRLPAGNYHLRNYSFRSGFSIDLYFTLSQDIIEDEDVHLGYYAWGTSGSITNADGVTKTGVYYFPSMTVRTVNGNTTLTKYGTITVSYTATAGRTYIELNNINTDETSPIVYIGDFDKAVFGSNTWVYSNFKQWCNNEAKSNNYKPTTPCDVPSGYNTGSGFLYGMDPRIKNIIQPVMVRWTSGQDFTPTKKYAYNTTYEDSERVFLLSMYEMGFNINTSEGKVSQLYNMYTSGVLNNSAVAARGKKTSASGSLINYRWARSSRVGNSNYAWMVTGAGGGDYVHAGSGFYAAVAFAIGA